MRKLRPGAVVGAVSCGTELEITQEAIPDVIPAEMCYLGWHNHSCFWRSWSRRRFRMRHDTRKRDAW